MLYWLITICNSAERGWLRKGERERERELRNEAGNFKGLLRIYIFCHSQWSVRRGLNREAKMNTAPKQLLPLGAAWYNNKCNLKTRSQ